MNRPLAAAVILVASLSASPLFAVEKWFVAHLAGTAGGAGHVDGAGAQARFARPYAVVADSSGNLFVADTFNSVIRRIAGDGTVSTIAGLAGEWGTIDGDRATARLDFPLSLALAPSGDIYFFESSGTVRRTTQAGFVTTVAGTPNVFGHADGQGASAKFLGAVGIVLDPSGNLYVADAGNSAIRKVTPSGLVSTIAGIPGVLGNEDGPYGVSTFYDPWGITRDAAGNLYVADFSASVVRRIDPSGYVTTLAGSALVSGSVDATGSAARFLNPSSITYDGSSLYVTDYSDQKIRQVTLSGVVTTLAGSVKGYIDAIGKSARFSTPIGIHAHAGSLYVTENQNHAIRRIAADRTVTTIAGVPPIFGSTDGSGTTARFDTPYSVAFAPDGSAFVIQQSSTVIRKVTRQGVVSSFGAMTESSVPGVAVNSLGEVFVSDRTHITKYTPAGVASNFAGDPTLIGAVDGTGSVVRFNGPAGMAFDGQDNLYVADRGNSTIRKITSGGVVTTLAGLAGARGHQDGTAGAARFSAPIDVAVDLQGNVYVADQSNREVRKVTPAGVVTTVAGIADGISEFADGPVATARFRSPSSIEVDAEGNVYVLDSQADNIRKIARGEVTTVAGRDFNAGSRNGAGLESRFNGPRGFAIDQDGTVVICDTLNHALRISHIPRRRIARR